MYKRTIDNRWSFKGSNTKEYTHCYHTYPAMMIPQIARTLIEEYIFSVIQSYLSEYKEELVEKKCFDNISNYSYWYSEDSLMRLSYLSQIINNHIPKELKDFFNTVLSEVVREVSFTRNGEFKRFRMPEEKIKTFKPDVFRLFEEKTLTYSHS